jgi:flavin-dependent dehydrogenase
MTLAIAGAGLAGSYLYRLLRDRDIDVDIYDIPIATRCGIAPCAWGASPEFTEHARTAGLDPKDYILKEIHDFYFGDMVVKADLFIIDKPKFQRDLVGRNYVIESREIPRTTKYEGIFDCTGPARAYLPPVDPKCEEMGEPDLVLPCVQFRCVITSRNPNTILIRVGKVGYSWSFPILGQEFHVGAGSLLEDPMEMLKASGLLPRSGDPLSSRTCGCKGNVRVSSPRFSRPFVAHSERYGCEIWGVGESVGTVSPLVGEGIIPSLRCVNIVLASYPDKVKYTHRLLREFEWMYRERRIVDKLIAGRSFTIRDWSAIMTNAKRMGIKLTYSEAVSILRQQFKRSTGK